MENTILSWAVGIIGSLVTFLTVVLMSYVNHVNNRFNAHETKNDNDVKDIHTKFEKYAKDDDLKSLRKEMLINQKNISDKLDQILIMVANKEDRK